MPQARQGNFVLFRRNWSVPYHKEFRQSEEEAMEELTKFRVEQIQLNRMFKIGL